MNIQLNGKYNKQALFHAISIYNFSDKEPVQTVLKCIRFLYQYRQYEHRICPSITALNTLLISLFDKYKNTEKYEIHEIIDIMIEYLPDGRKYLDELKRIQDEKARLKREKYVQNTIYSDRQNVHSSSINNSVKLAAKKLVDKYYTDNYTLNDIKLSLNENQVINNVLNRISTDISNFNINISLNQVIISLWNWIHLRDNMDEISELKKILTDEITHMNEMCASGHLSRLINVTQGFTDEFTINISIMDQCNAVIRNYLNKRLEQCTDEKVIDGMMYRDKYYLDFIHNCIHEKIDYFKAEYGDEFVQHLENIVNKF